MAEAEGVETGRGREDSEGATRLAGPGLAAAAGPNPGQGGVRGVPDGQPTLGVEQGEVVAEEGRGAGGAAGDAGPPPGGATRCGLVAKG